MFERIYHDVGVLTLTRSTGENDDVQRRRHVAHWGPFNALVRDGVLIGIEPFEHDPHPTPLIEAFRDTIDAKSRIRAPMVRKSWLEGGPGSATDRRGIDPFVEVSWDVAEQLVADELERVGSDHGNEAIFAGSYGWASAGRFHHPQSQLKSFLKLFSHRPLWLGNYSARQPLPDRKSNFQ